MQHDLKLLKKFKKSEEESMGFFASYLLLFTRELQTVAASSCSRQIRNKTEIQLNNALVLIELMHMHLMTRNLLIEEALLLPNSVENNWEHSEVELALLHLEKTVATYPFTQNLNGIRCKKLIKRIKGYHFSHSIKIVILNPTLPPPWKPLKKTFKITCKKKQEVTHYE